MHQIINQLHLDHQNISILLKLLKKQIDHLETGEYTDMELVSDILHYFMNYPAVHHHPPEDIIFAALKRKDLSFSDEIDEIYSEHEILEEESSRLMDKITQIQGEAIYSREEIVQELNEYVSIYNKHMDREDSELIPAVEKSLADNDWKSIESEMNIKADPLFGKIIDDQYNNLYKLILSSAEED